MRILEVCCASVEELQAFLAFRDRIVMTNNFIDKIVDDAERVHLRMIPNRLNVDIDSLKWKGSYEY